MDNSVAFLGFNSEDIHEGTFVHSSFSLLIKTLAGSSTPVLIYHLHDQRVLDESNLWLI